ncbi:MAG: type II toxin-antitoxin system YafQ family toxin, partial [Alphaproteobacteria bacterium]|nr:type II toxin-antitoxin system YafQ family toxin [Alphaproteobacteria bacterium]
MRNIVRHNRFIKDARLAIKRGKDDKKLERILLNLVQDIPLPQRSKPHKLTGNWAGCWECHIEPDWL